MNISLINYNPANAPRDIAPLPQETTSVFDILEDSPTTPDRKTFCIKAVRKTLDAIKEQRYSAFDAKTTTNCCHGISHLTSSLIRSLNTRDLESASDTLDSTRKIPLALKELTQLFLLGCMRASNIETRSISLYTNLQNIESSLSSKFCNTFGRQLQKKLGNMVANRYQIIADALPKDSRILGLDKLYFSKYVSEQFLRIDEVTGLRYAPSIFTMQVILTDLIHQKAVIAVINDISDMNDKFCKKYIKLLRGNGTDNFVELPLNTQLDEPIFAFSGKSRTSNPNEVAIEMDKMVLDFPSLVLANDTFYPQFPAVVLKKNPIVAEEEPLRELIEKHSKVSGVSAEDPSLYCLTHISLLGPHEIQAIMNDQNTPSPYKIPLVS